MKSAPTRLYHVEGAIRPSGVRWLTNKSIIICRTAGTLELQPDWADVATVPYRTGVGNCRLERISDSAAVFVVGKGRCEQISEGERGLAITSGILPEEIGPIGTCVIPHSSLYLIASRDGTLWQSSDAVSWVRLGKLNISEITAGCVVSPEQYAFASARGEIEFVLLKPFLAKGRQHIHADAVQDLFALDKDIVGSVSRDRALRIWRVGKNVELLWSVVDVHEHFINCAVRIENDIWTGSSDGTIAITSISERRRKEIFKGHADAIRTLDLSLDKTKLLSLSDDATYIIYDTNSRKMLRRYGQERQYIRSGDFRITGEKVSAAFGSTAGFLYSGEVEKGAFSKTQVSDRSLRVVRHLDDNRIICGDDTGVVGIIDNKLRHVSTSAPTGAGLTAIRLNSNNQTLLCGYRDGYIRVLSAPSLAVITQKGLAPANNNAESHKTEESQTFTASLVVARKIHESIVGDLVMLPNSLLLSCSDDHTIRTLLLDSLSVLDTTASLDGTAINNLLVLSDHLVATTDGGNVFVLDLNSREILARYADHRSPVRAISGISSSLVATGDRQGEVRVWDITTRDTRLVNGFSERIIELAYDPRTERLYVISEAEVASMQLGAHSMGSSPSSVTLSKPERLAGKGTQTHTVSTSAPEFEDIEIAKLGKSFNLTQAEDRLIRGFAKSRGGSRCELGLLSGGLSDARVFRAEVLDHLGARRINAVAKIGKRSNIDTEVKGYDSEISRLSPNATPRRIQSPEIYDEDTAGVFYSLAEGFDRSLFQVTVQSPETLEQVIAEVTNLALPWRLGVPESKASVAEIRRRVLDDRQFQQIVEQYKLTWVEDFERRSVQVRKCTVHGDLHGGNILVSQTSHATIIDYGDVGEGSVVLDPITLELSHFFHPDGPLRDSPWPDAARANLWMTEGYLLDCPIPQLCKACWRWTKEVCASHREIAAAAYAYLLRQLKYKETNTDRALNLLSGVRTFYEST